MGEGGSSSIDLRGRIFPFAYWGYGEAPMRGESVRFCVVGGGSWGTAMASHLARRGHSVVLWAREEEVVQGIRRSGRNPLFLSDVSLPDRLDVTDSLPEALTGAEVVVMAVPSCWCEEVALSLAPHLPPKAVVLNLAKGFHSSGRRLSEVLMEILRLDPDRLAVLSGPNHAEEVVREVPSATVVASAHLPLARRLQEELSSPYFRVYTNDDLVGVEVGGAYKNVIAVAAGVLDGLGLGDNTKASLITRGLAEMTRFGAALGANPITFSGLSGVGDLIVTCVSRHSRNRGFGERIGRGERAQEVLMSSRMVVEGVFASRIAVKMAKELGVEVPIAEVVHRVIVGEVEPREAVTLLMTRRLREETEEDIYRAFLLGQRQP